MTDHEERPPNALAHGPVKSDDIERVRSLAREIAKRNQTTSAATDDLPS